MVDARGRYHLSQHYCRDRKDISEETSTGGEGGSSLAHQSGEVEREGGGVARTEQEARRGCH